MGWKNVKTHYGIEHIVRIKDGRIFIGSEYIHDIIVIEADGTLSKKDSRGGLGELQQRLLNEADILRELIKTPDQFERSVTVYTFDEAGKIIEKQCETPGWPHMTHDGFLMHENCFSLDRETAIKRAYKYVRGGIKIFKENVAEAESRLDRQKALLAKEIERLAELESLYPGYD